MSKRSKELKKTKRQKENLDVKGGTYGKPSQNIFSRRNFILNQLSLLGENTTTLRRTKIQELCNKHIYLTNEKYIPRRKHKKVYSKKGANNYIKKILLEIERGKSREAYKKKYYMYLSSKEWRSKRNLIISERGAKCEICGSMDNLQVHHKTYERVFNEELNDLQLLCKTCHMMEHDIE